MGLRSLCSMVLAAALALAVGPSTAPAGPVMNVEVDWLETAGHSHQPSQCELDAVVHAFALHGITLVIELDDAVTETAANQVIAFVSPGLFDAAAGEWFDIESVHRDHAAGTGWHYCVFGHDYTYDGGATGSSGLAEFGDEFVVTLGSFTGGIGTPWDRSGTFMHEFGHNLSLRHSGDQDKGIGVTFKLTHVSCREAA